MTKHASEEPAALREALDRLYTAEPSEFTALRKRLASELADAKHGDLAKRVAASHKPDKAAWILNRLVASDAGVLRAVFEAFDDAAKHQLGKNADAWRRSLASYREGLGGLAHAIRDLTGDADAGLLRKIVQTVQAAAVDPEVRERVLSARLEKSTDASDSLVGLGAPETPRANEHAPAKKKEAKKDAREAKKRALEAAKREREEKERERKEKERERERAKKIAAAEKRVAAAERAFEEAREELESAREALRAL